MFEDESIETRGATSKQPEHHRGAMAHITGRDPFSSAHHSNKGSAASRIAELEIENLRLQRLVAELLIKNQQLRKRGE
jgi:hypothetical protein